MEEYLVGTDESSRYFFHDKGLQLPYLQMRQSIGPLLAQRLRELETNAGIV